MNAALKALVTLDTRDQTAAVYQDHLLAAAQALAGATGGGAAIWQQSP